MKKVVLLVGILVIFLPVSIFASVPQADALYQINQKVCSRFEEDTARLAGIMEEVRARKGIKETRVAFGGIDDAIKSADYQITYVAEAIAFQRTQKFSGESDLRYSLEVLRSKILKAKAEVAKAI